MDDWVTIPSLAALGRQESLRDRVCRVKADLEDLNRFYNISISDKRYKRLHSFFLDETASLESIEFEKLTQHDKVDYLLLRNFLRRQSRQLDQEHARIEGYAILIPFASLVISICEDRQQVEPVQPEHTVQKLHQVKLDIEHVTVRIRKGKLEVEKASALRAADVVAELRDHLAETHRFYDSYDPTYSWWVGEGWKSVDAALEAYIPLIKYELAGMHPDIEDEIVGKPIGREALLVELQAEMIA